MTSLDLLTLKIYYLESDVADVLDERGQLLTLWRQTTSGKWRIFRNSTTRRSWRCRATSPVSCEEWTLTLVNGQIQNITLCDWKQNCLTIIIKPLKTWLWLLFVTFFPFQILDANTMFINKKIQTEACKNRWILIFTEAVNAMVKPVSTLYDCPFNNTCSFSWETSRLIGAFGQAIVEYSFIHLKQCLF